MDEYPGAIFTVLTKTGDDSPVSPTLKRRKGSCAQFDINVDTHNYQYEPNADSLHDPKDRSSPQRGPCHVEPDYWEFMANLGIVIRHHRRPRRGFFETSEFSGGPDAQSLRPERLTRVNGGPDIWDMWPSKIACPSQLVCWAGQTVFLLN